MVDSRLHVARVSLNVQLKAPDYLLKKRLPASLIVLGNRVADQVISYCNRMQLNYYPALDYFQQQQAIEAYLLDAMEEASDITANLCRSEIFRLLTPVFSNVAIDSIQCLAYTMPTCRPGKQNSRKKLAEHYTPDLLKVQLTLSSIQRQQATPGFEKYVSSTVVRWLKEVFDEPRITAPRLIQDETA